jgi:hypothetical protein
LKINESKTKYMIASEKERTIRDDGQSMAFGDKTFKVFKKFVYLGSMMTPNNDVRLEIQRRIQTANRCLWTAQTIAFRASFTSNKIHHLQDLYPPNPAV